MAGTHTTARMIGAPFRLLQAGATFSGSRKAPGPLLLRDMYFGGNGAVYGTVAQKSDLVNTPLRRRVLLIEDQSRRAVRETWSASADGAYRFDNLDSSKKYTALSYDHTGDKRAVVADGLVPEVTA